MKSYTVRLDIVVTDSEEQVSEVEVVQVVYTCDTSTEAQAFAGELVALANRKL